MPPISFDFLVMCFAAFVPIKLYADAKSRDENPEHAPCYFNSGSAGGEVKRRKLTDDAISDPEVLSAKGNGRYPLLYMEGAGDGDLLATSDTAERANPCGDPEPRVGRRDLFYESEPSMRMTIASIGLLATTSEEEDVDCCLPKQQQS